MRSYTAANAERRQSTQNNEQVASKISNGQLLTVNQELLSRGLKERLKELARTKEEQNWSIITSEVQTCINFTYTLGNNVFMSIISPYFLVHNSNGEVRCKFECGEYLRYR